MDGGTERIVWLCFILLVVVVYLLMADMTPLRRLAWAMQPAQSEEEQGSSNDVRTTPSLVTKQKPVGAERSHQPR